MGKIGFLPVGFGCRQVRLATAACQRAGEGYSGYAVFKGVVGLELMFWQVVEGSDGYVASGFTSSNFASGWSAGILVLQYKSLCINTENALVLVGL